MNNTFKKLLAVALCLALAVALLPAFAVTSKAAGVAPSAGVLLFEDTFDDGNYNGWTKAGNTITVSQGVVSFATNGNTYLDQTITGLSIPVGAVLCMEYSAATTNTTNTYWNRLSTSSTTGSLTFDATRSDVASGTGLGTTNTEEPVTHYQYFTVSKGVLDQVSIRVGQRGSSGTGTVKVDYVRLYLVTDPATALATENGFATLTEDVTVNGSLTLAENAVLDLNGHKLTATSVQGGTNAQIIDSSADRSGMIETLALQLDNANNPQLPLWTGTGYIFTEPKLNEEDVKRAIMSNVSDNGFTLDFRPGFGEDIRTNYLQSGNSGIAMTASLSWTDKDGVNGALDTPITATEIFNGMYESATHRGRLILTGAKDYQRIALTLTLSSCGVVKTFDPVVFGKTVHFAADFETGSLENNYYYATAGNIYYRSADCAIVTKQNGDATDNKAIKLYTTNDLNFAENIVKGAGKKLVIEFDLLTPAGEDNFALRHKKTGVAGGGYVHYLHSKNLDGNAYFYRGVNMTGNLSAANVFTKVRMEIDLENGQYMLSYNGQKLTGKYDSAPTFFDNQKMTYLYVYGDTIEHYFDNILIYTVGDMS